MKRREDACFVCVCLLQWRRVVLTLLDDVALVETECPRNDGIRARLARAEALARQAAMRATAAEELVSRLERSAVVATAATPRSSPALVRSGRASMPVVGRGPGSGIGGGSASPVGEGDDSAFQGLTVVQETAAWRHGGHAWLPSPRTSTSVKDPCVGIDGTELSALGMTLPSRHVSVEAPKTERRSPAPSPEPWRSARPAASPVVRRSMSPEGGHWPVAVTAVAQGSVEALTEHGHPDPWVGVRPPSQRSPGRTAGEQSPALAGAARTPGVYAATPTGNLASPLVGHGRTFSAGSDHFCWASAGQFPGVGSSNLGGQGGSNAGGSAGAGGGSSGGSVGASKPRVSTAAAAICEPPRRSPSPSPSRHMRPIMWPSALPCTAQSLGSPGATRSLSFVGLQVPQPKSPGPVASVASVASWAALSTPLLVGGGGGGAICARSGSIRSTWPSPAQPLLTANGGAYDCPGPTRVTQP